MSVLSQESATSTMKRTTNHDCVTSDNSGIAQQTNMGKIYSVSQLAIE